MIATAPRNIFLIFLLTFLFTLPGKTQLIVDSLRLTWSNPEESDSIRFWAINQYYIQNTYALPDSSFRISQYHYRLAKEKNVIEEMANAKNEQALVYYIKGKPNEAMARLNETADLLLQINYTLPVGRLYCNIGIIHTEQNQYQKALQKYSKALEIFRAENSFKDECNILNNIGLVYYYIDSDDIALEYFHRAISGYTKTNQKEKTGTTWNHIAAVNIKKEEFEASILNIKKGLAIIKSNNDRFAESDSYFLLAKSFQKLNQVDSSFYYVDKSLAIDKAIENETNILERRTLKADLTFDKEVELATKSAEDLLKSVNKDTPNELKADLYHLLYKCYKKQGDSDLSLKMHEQFATYNDSVQIEKNKMAVIQEAVQNDYEIKLHENNLENEKERDQLKSTQLKKTLAIGLIAGLSILGILLYFKQNNKKNRLERDALLVELEELKKSKNAAIVVPAAKFELNRNKIEASIQRKLNETDWKILTILLNDPVISNKKIAEEAIMSVDGIGSSLIRMYNYFDIKNSKYKKISLLMDAIKMSNKDI